MLIKARVQRFRPDRNGASKMFEDREGLFSIEENRVLLCGPRYKSRAKGVLKKFYTTGEGLRLEVMVEDSDTKFHLEAWDVLFIH